MWTSSLLVASARTSRSSNTMVLCGVKPVLIQGLLWNELRAGTKQDFDMLVGQVAVASGDADDQIRLIFTAALEFCFLWRSTIAAHLHDLAHDALDERAVELCCS